MQQKGARYVRVRALWLAAALAAAFWARDLIWQAVVQLFFGMLVALAALPVMKRLEKRFSPGASATLSITSLSALLIASLLLLAPALITQGRQLIAMLPAMYNAAEEWLVRAQGWLAENGIALDGELRGSLLSRGEEALSAAAPAAMAWVGGVAGSLGKWMLAPVFGFYFLRDRRQIGQWLLSLTPVEKRDMIVHILREMRRETAGYLRGQLMVSAVVGGLTALGLMFCGVPAWLLLGVIMGVLELIPYVGPFLGGVLVAVFPARRTGAHAVGAGRGHCGAATGGRHAVAPADERRHPSAPCGGGPVCDAGRHSGRHRRNPAVGTAAFVRSGRTAGDRFAAGGRQGPALA